VQLADVAARQEQAAALQAAEAEAREKGAALAALQAEHAELVQRAERLPELLEMEKVGGGGGDGGECSSWHVLSSTWATVCACRCCAALPSSMELLGSLLPCAV
jgi:hypothetical protein